MVFFITGILLLCTIALYLIRPQSETKTPLIQQQSILSHTKPQTVIANTELAALNISQPIST